MENSDQIKELVKELQDAINSGFKLFNEYKQVSKGFVNAMNNEIANTGLRFQKGDTLLFRKEKVEELYKDTRKSFLNPVKNMNLLNKYDFFSPPFINMDEAKKKQELYKIYTNLQSIIKNMIIYEKEFIRYKKQKRKEKAVLYKNIIALEESLKQILTKKQYKELLSKIVPKGYKFSILLDHLRAGIISNNVNNLSNNVDTYKELGHFLKREKKMTENTKQIINAIKATKKKEKISNNRVKLLEKLSNIKQKIIKLYEKKLVGAPLPPKFEDVIKILEKQELLKNDKSKFEKLKKIFKELVSELKKSNNSS